MKSSARYLWLILFAPILLTACNSDDPDITAPVISLNGQNQIDTEVFMPFSDPGATAQDSRDGSVSVTVQGLVDTDTLGIYTLTYTAVDASGNEASANRVVKVIDSTPPLIELVDVLNYTIQRGDEYRELGATATDNFDSEITVTISSDLDSKAAGEYSVNYSATDSSGNTASVIREITVTPKQFKLTLNQFGEGTVAVLNGPDLDCLSGFDCFVTVDENTTILLAAEALSPWIFHSFRGCDEVDALPVNQCSITMTSDTVASLTFSPNEDGYEFTLAGNAVELDEPMKSSILEYNQDTGVITLERLADLSNYATGKIIASNGVVDPDGVRTDFFLRRVERVVGNDSSLKIVQTSEATLTDLIEEGTFVYQQPLTAEDVNETALPEGLSLVKSETNQTSNNSPVEFLATNLVLYDADGNSSTTGDQISFTGGFKVFLNPDFVLDIDFPAKVQEFRSVAYVDIDTEAGLDIGGQVVISERKLRAISVNFAAIPLGPLVIVPGLDIDFVFNASAGVTIKPRVIAKTDFVAGASYRSGAGWNGVSDSEFTVTTNGWADLVEVKATAAIGPEIKLSTRLYGIAGPNVTAKGVVGLEVFPVFNSELCVIDINTFLEATAGFGADFRILTKRFDYKIDLIKYKFIIDALSRTCDTGIPGVPSNLAVEQGPDSSLEVNWLAVGDGAEISYKIIRNNVGIVSNYLDSEFTDTDLTIGQEYCYEIIATDDSNNESAASEKICAIVMGEDKEAPSMPVSLVAMPLSSTALNLSWSASQDNVGVAGYTVYKKDGDTFRALSGSIGTQADVLQLESDTEYCFAVSAFDAEANVSEQSTQVCVSTLPAEEAKWTMFIKCSTRDNYVVEDTFDLNEEFTEEIFVFGQATDYDGSEMFYNMFGTYDFTNTEFNGEINWSFEGSERLRKDAFSVDLSLGDTGDVAMDQLQRTGCDAEIRFINLVDENGAPEMIKQESPESHGSISGLK